MNIWLVMKASDGTERPFPVRERRTLIGRESRCDVRIAVPSVADRHCELVLDGSDLRLKDLDTEHGTFVNGRRVRDTTLAHADELKVGPVTFEVRLRDKKSAAGRDNGGKAMSTGGVLEIELPSDVVNVPQQSRETIDFGPTERRIADAGGSGGV